MINITYSDYIKELLRIWTIVTSCPFLKYNTKEEDLSHTFDKCGYCLTMKRGNIVNG